MDTNNGYILSAFDTDSFSHTNRYFIEGKSNYHNFNFYQIIDDCKNQLDIMNIE